MTTRDGRGTGTARRRGSPPPSLGEQLTLAWGWLAFLPLGLYLGWAGERLPFLFGDAPVDAEQPLWWELMMAGLVLGVAWIPVGGWLWCSRRAFRAGSRAARIPLMLALSLGAVTGVMLTNVVIG